MTLRHTELSEALQPIVKRMIDVPREGAVEMLADEFRTGLTYRQALAALLVAASSCEGTHHEVYLVYSAHQMSLDSVGADRLIPVFWGLDSLKRAQENYAKPPRDALEGVYPTGDKALLEFREAMDSWDQGRAERSLIGLSRSWSPRDIIEELWHYGAKEWGFIGHKIIAVANCWRSLQTVGWHYSEPILRFIVSDLMSRVGDLDSQPYRENMERATRASSLAPDWVRAGFDESSTLELLSEIRAGEMDRATDMAYRQIVDSGVPAGAVWDAVFLSAGEFMHRHKQGGYAGSGGINTRPLHSNTVANAMHYAFEDTVSQTTRLFVLLQAVGWVANFIGIEHEHGNLRDRKITDLAPKEGIESSEDATEEVFSLLPSREMRQQIEDRSGIEEAEKLAFTYGKKAFGLDTFLRRSRQLVQRKANPDAHDYKFPVAIFQNYGIVSPMWRPYMMATSVNWLHSASKPDSDVYQRFADQHLNAGGDTV